MKIQRIVISAIAVMVVTLSMACATSSADIKSELDTVSEQMRTYSSMRASAHEQANALRTLGVLETDDTIQSCKVLWYHWNTEFNALVPQYNKLKADYEKALADEKRQEESKGRYIGTFKITAYTPDPAENGGYAVTAMGTPLAGNEWAVCAVDPRVIPLGSTIYIEGVGNVKCLDTGGAIKGNIIDLLVGYGQARSWGIQYRKIYLK